MQETDPQIAAVLRSRSRDLTDVVEFYAWSYELGPAGFDATQAIKRYASVGNVRWSGVRYKRQFTGRSDIERSMGPSFNHCSIKFSNVNRELASFILSNEVEGTRMVVRTISRSLPAASRASVVLFTGRIEKPGQINKSTAQISAKQDLATVQHEVPWRTYEHQCPLEFKDEGCMGGETLAQKTQAFRDAIKCDKARDGDCARYGNTKMFQGFRIRPISGTYRYYTTERRKRGPFGIFGHKNVQVAHDAQWSSEDKTPYGEPVAIPFGLVQVEGVPLEVADIGTAVKWLMSFGEGPADAVTNIKNRTQGLQQPNNVTVHLGEYGGQGTQGHDQQFPNSDLYSRTIYAGGSCPGGSAEAHDPIPVITAVVRGMKVPLPDANGVFNQFGWTDNPAYLTRFALTDPRLFGISPNLIDDPVCWDTGKFCDEVLIDDSNGERTFVAADERPNIGRAASQHRLFRSTGLIDARYFRYRLGLDQEVPEFADPDLEDFDPVAPPQAIAPVRYLRRRYTANTLLGERMKLVDFLFKVLLPSFRGYIVIGSNGKLQIRCERPVDSARVRAAAAVGAQSIAVDNAEAWRGSLRGEVLIGTGLTTSEVRQVTGARYSLAGNQISLNAQASGTLTATRSGATLNGGTEQAPAQGTITLGGTPQDGAQALATIDGVQAVYTLTALDTLETAAAMLAQMINATPALRKFCVASYAGAAVTIKSKLGWLDLNRALVNAHGATEEVLRIAGHFDASSIHDGSFNWPLASDQPVNQIVIKYRDKTADFARRELRVNDKAHQKRTGKTDKHEVSGAAVDSLHQAARLAEAEFAKRREGDFLCSWSTGAAGLVYEEGDVVAVTDSSGGFVNLPVRIEKLRITEKREVHLTARLYSTIMFSDEVGQHTVLLPTTLRTQAIDMDVPSAVLDLRAASGQGTVSLSWQRPTANARGIDYYELRVGDSQMNGQVAGLLPGLDPKRVESNTYTFPLAADLQTYYWSVRAHNSFGTGPETQGSFVASSSVYDSVDTTVPVVTAAPTVNKADGVAQWMVYVPYPDSNGYSVTDCEVEVRKDSDNALVQTIPIGRTTRTQLAQQAFDCRIRYRWRNQYRGTTASPSDGWSAWSPHALGYGSSNTTNTNSNDGNFTGYQPDPEDIFNPRTRDTY